MCVYPIYPIYIYIHTYKQTYIYILVPLTNTFSIFVTQEQYWIYRNVLYSLPSSPES